MVRALLRAIPLHCKILDFVVSISKRNMGLLSEGTPLSWEETRKWADHVKQHGIVQFINLYKKLKNRTNDTLKWGDEIEYTLFHLDYERQSARLHLNASKILPFLQEEENRDPSKNLTAWRMEYADYMVEGTPGQPFGGCMRHFNAVEANMKLRREQMASLLKSPNQRVICITSFPRIGCPEFTFPIYPASPEHNKESRSLFYPDEAIYPAHPRFRTLTRNIRSRRGRKQIINLPVFRDTRTPKPFLDALPNDDGEGAIASKPDHVYLDCMGFGMGCSCLQVTFQACNIEEARVLYDQLAVLAPIMLALSASSPAFKGTLVNLDCRWSVISGAVDDRTREELGEMQLPTGPKFRGMTFDVPGQGSKFVIPKSRYDGIDMYLSEDGNKYNDQPILYEDKHLNTLLDAGIDRQLAEHVAHLFIRDPISLFKEKLFLDNENETDHFENIQSTNWQSIRFKPPPPNSKIGWRVEFRSMEVQLTDFENAAYVVFIVLLTRVILSYDLNLLVPISKVEENMRTAIERDAIRQGKFYFRKCMQRDGEMATDDVEDCCEPMSIDMIINGKDGEFPGLIPLMDSYMATVDVDIDTRCTISQYLKLISMRASGELMTMARWMRSFIRSHPEYKQDSHISEKINYDLIVTADKISKGEIGCPELFANPETKTTNVLPYKCKQMEEEMEQQLKEVAAGTFVPNGINSDGERQEGKKSSVPKKVAINPQNLKNIADLNGPKHDSVNGSDLRPKQNDSELSYETSESSDLSDLNGAER